MNAIDHYRADVDLLEDYLAFLMINESLPDCIKRMEFEKAIRSLKIITSELNHITAKANAIKNRKNVLVNKK